ncbi:Hypothetical predicted protein [Mytilus galloprovincialis]|uniref:Uncharacterized protein n=1 Tax=Mytilus galloprovincialis TaxID=29158 RepID=A0A8B6FT67_MYTGA|nr:Hypothetical predicted protein [Mytilus galloprovincialis]
MDNLDESSTDFGYRQFRLELHRFWISTDDHSGVPLVTLKIVTQSGEIKYEHRYKDADLIVSASDCQNIVECYCTQADRNKCYRSTLRLEIDNCWMGVAMNATTTETYKLEITSYNGAMLSRKTIKERVPRWKPDKADWSLFENLCQAELQSKMFETVQDPILTFNTVLTSIADRTIPKISANPKHPSKPWFDDACDQAIGDRKKSERRFNQQPTTENLKLKTSLSKAHDTACGPDNIHYPTLKTLARFLARSSLAAHE